jgi:hypothetical protein
MNINKAKKHSILVSYITLFILIFSIYCEAHPVIWKGGMASMLKVNNNNWDIETHYSLTYKDSIGVRMIDNKNYKKTIFMGKYNRLIKRWNMPTSQGNIYLSTGVGGGEKKEILPYAYMQADWETRRWYTFGMTEYLGGGTPYYHTAMRGGVAPYLAEFDSIHTWLILQLSRTQTEKKEEWSLIPVIRVFKDTILVEIGSNFKDKMFFAFMKHI